MALYVNEIFPGLETDEREGLLDVYAFLVGPDVYIEVLKVRLSLAVAKAKFISSMIDREMQTLPRELRSSPSRREVIRKKFAPRREFVEENGAYVIRETGGAVGAWLYMVYDSEMSRMNLSQESTPSLEVQENTESGVMNANLLNAVTDWTSEYFGAPREDLEFVSGPVPFTDYQIHTLSEYPIIYQMAGDLKMSIRMFDQMNILLIDFYAEKGGNREGTEIFKKLEASIPGFDGSKEVFMVGGFAAGQAMGGERFVYEHDGKPVFSLDPPFYIVNRAGKRPIGIANMLLSDIIQSHSGSDVATPESRLRDRLRLSYYMGSDLGNTTYKLIYDGAFKSVQSTQRESMLRALGIEESELNSDALDLLGFLDMMMNTYHDISSSSLGNPFDQRYYVTVEAGEVKNPEIFDVVCEVVDKQDGMYLLRSPFNMPPEVYAMFGLPKVADMYTLDPASSTLTENLSYRVDSRRNKRDWTAPSGTTPGSIAKSMREDAELIIPGVEDRHNEALLVHGLASIPACNVPAQNMFNRRSVPFQDIIIILVHNEADRGTLGGFAGARQNAGPISLFENVKPFQPPFIMLNLLAPGMATIEDRVAVILHEVSHFIDELMILDGLADPSIMDAPQHPQVPGVAEQMRYWQDYLGKSQTEIDAHTEEAYYYLSMYEYDYALRNKSAIGKKIVKEILGPVSELEPQSVTVERMRLYNQIFERAWDMYENDHLVDVETVPSIDEENEELD